MLVTRISWSLFVQVAQNRGVLQEVKWMYRVRSEECHVLVCFPDWAMNNCLTTAWMPANVLKFIYVNIFVFCFACSPLWILILISLVSEGEGLCRRRKWYVKKEKMIIWEYNLLYCPKFKLQYIKLLKCFLGLENERKNMGGN